VHQAEASSQKSTGQEGLDAIFSLEVDMVTQIKRVLFENRTEKYS
jgi:hypothetical protein